MIVKVSRIEPNPFRRLDHYKILQDKVDELKNSITETTFWGGLLARENPEKKGHYQLAFGHHRIEAIRQLEIKEIDIQIRDIDDSLLLRMMANENLDTWKTTPSVINETVLAAKEFIEREIKNYKTWTEVNNTKSYLINLLDRNLSEGKYQSLKKDGVGQTIILKFLNGADNWKDGNWKQWMIQDALTTIQESQDEEIENKETKIKTIRKAIIDREAVEEFPTTKQATAFRRSVKAFEVPPHEQKELAKKILKEGKDSTRDIQKAVKEKSIEDKKSKAVTIQEKQKINQDAEIAELEELVNKTISYATILTASLSDLNQKLEKLNVTEFKGLNVMKFNFKLFDLGNALKQISKYTKYSFTMKEKEDE